MWIKCNWKLTRSGKPTVFFVFPSLPGESSDPLSSPLTSILGDMMRILRVYLYPILYLTFSFVLMARPTTPLQPQVVQRAPDPELHQSSANLTGPSKRACSEVVMCTPGIVLPVWLPLNPPAGEQAGRAVVYFFCLMYMFLGVSIIADRFMASIEVITSQVLSIIVFSSNIKWAFCFSLTILSIAVYVLTNEECVDSQWIQVFADDIVICSEFMLKRRRHGLQRKTVTICSS